MNKNAFDGSTAAIGRSGLDAKELGASIGAQHNTSTQHFLAGDFAVPRCAARLSHVSSHYAMPLDSRFPTMSARYSTLRAGLMLGSTPGLFQYERMMVWVESGECEVHDQAETSAACTWMFLYAIQRQV